MSELTTICNAAFIAHFVINVCSLLLLLRFVYYRHSPNRDMLFGFFLFGCGVFLVTRLLHNVEMSMGFAFGLFAVFSMLRYRTESISIRDMTYLFIVIVVSLMSSVGPISITELIILNALVCILAAISETSLLAPRVAEKKVLYENIENVRPDRYQELLLELRERTGLAIIKIETGNIDYLKDTAKLRIFYKETRSEREKYRQAQNKTQQNSLFEAVGTHDT